MKTFISTVNKLSISIDGKVQELHPFYLVADEYADEVGKIKGMVAVSDLYDVNVMKNLSYEVTCDRLQVERISEEIDLVFEDLHTRLTTISNLQSKLDVMIEDIKLTQSNILQSLNSAVTVANEIKAISLDGKAEAIEFQNKIDNKKDEIYNTLTDLSVRISKEMKAAVTEIEGKYKQVINKLDDTQKQTEKTLQKYTDKAEMSANTAKKWATNPENIPVENGLFSAYHYAKLGAVSKKETA